MEQTKDYKSYLSKIAKQMILIHDPNLLSRLVIRTLTRNLGIKHAGLFLYNKYKKEYIINVSSGKKGLKIPVGFTKITDKNNIIQFFLNKDISINNNTDYLLVSQIKDLKEKNSSNKEITTFLTELEDEISLYKAQLIVPGFFRKDLMVVFFIGNKIDGSSFSKEDMDFLTILSSDVVMAIQNAKLFDDIKKQLDINKQLLLNTVETLATAIDIKNSYTHGHTERVMKYSMTLLKYIPQEKLKDFEDFENMLKISALLHDIGKIGIPESILNKSGKLLPEEIKLIEKHPSLGAEILEPIKEFKTVSLGVKYHHERYDGKGYPYGLTGDNIPLIATIISVADAYDAMVSDRPYRKGLDKAVAIKEIISNKNKQFSPIVVDAFLEAVYRNEI